MRVNNFVWTLTVHISTVLTSMHSLDLTKLAIAHSHANAVRIPDCVSEQLSIHTKVLYLHK